MKSISIVYKTNKREIQSQRVLNHQGRRSIDEYYSKLSEQESKKEQLLQRIRSQTAKAAKIRDKVRVFSSMNIHSIGKQKIVSGGRQSPEKEQNWTKIKKYNLKKPMNNFLTIKLPEHNENNLIEQVKLRTKELSKHSKLKILGKVKNSKETTLVLSIDFIMNQFNFWDEEDVEEGTTKAWKALMPLANIIWLVKRQTSAKKLEDFAKIGNLRIDGIVQIDPVKKETLNISYYNLERQLKLEKKNKLLIINSLKGGNVDDLSQSEFKSALPLLAHAKTYVHFVKIEMNEKNRLQQVMKVLNKQLPSPINISEVFKFEEMKRVLNPQSKKLLNEQYMDWSDVYEEMEKIKVKMCKQFDHSIGLTTKIEGDSVQFLIGDMLKRNYKFFMNLYCNRLKKKSPYKYQTKKTKPYTRPIYIWQL